MQIPNLEYVRCLFYKKIFVIFKKKHFTCSSSASVQNGLLWHYCRLVESAIQWFQIHNRITIASIHNPAVYLLGARVSIFISCAPNYKVCITSTISDQKYLKSGYLHHNMNSSIICFDGGCVYLAQRLHMLGRLHQRYKIGNTRMALESHKSSCKLLLHFWWRVFIFKTMIAYGAEITLNIWISTMTLESKIKVKYIWN